jgi:hypothetical protein
LTVIAACPLAQPADHRPGEREDQNAAGYEVPGSGVAPAEAYHAGDEHSGGVGAEHGEASPGRQRLAGRRELGAPDDRLPGRGQLPGGGGPP